MKPCYPRRIAVLAISVAFPAFASAADPAAPARTPPAAADAPAYSDRAHMDQWSSEKERLESALKAGIGKDRAFFREELERLGYRITAVNKDKSDELEYEVVNGRNSYEVQVDFERKTSAARKVDVSSNLWKAAATKMAMKDSNYKVDYPKTVGPDAATYSDRARMKAWASEKQRLEKALKIGQSKDYYRAELAKLGYEVTAVNEAKAGYVEYEIVRGQNSYEVQVDFDKATGRSTKVDVTSNLWEHEDTDRALERKNTATKETRAKP